VYFLTIVQRQRIPRPLVAKSLSGRYVIKMSEEHALQANSARAENPRRMASEIENLSSATAAVYGEPATLLARASELTF
jgi:hypothetical protein